jgi:hypothetical protein
VFQLHGPSACVSVSFRAGRSERRGPRGSRHLVGRKGFRSAAACVSLSRGAAKGNDSSTDCLRNVTPHPSARMGVMALVRWTRPCRSRHSASTIPVDEPRGGAAFGPLPCRVAVGHRRVVSRQHRSASPSPRPVRQVAIAKRVVRPPCIARRAWHQGCILLETAGPIGGQTLTRLVTNQELHLGQNHRKDHP